MKLKDDVTKKLNVDMIIKTLGAHVNPTLNFKDEFARVKNKMTTSIKKIMRVEMKEHQAHACCNAQMLTNVCFGHIIVKLNADEIKELKKTHELPMLRKLGLGNDFPRRLLRVQKSSLGVVLIDFNAAIDMLAIKMFVGNKRSQVSVSKVMVAQEELSFVDS